MSALMGSVYIAGDTAIFDNTITDLPAPIGSGSAMDPDSHVIKLIKPDGTQSGVDMSPQGGAGSASTGYFWQKVAISADGPPGEWILEWQIIVDTEKSTERFRFRVVD